MRSPSFLDAPPPLLPADTIPVDHEAIVAACRQLRGLHTKQEVRAFLAAQGLEPWGRVSLTKVGMALGVHVWGGMALDVSLVHEFYRDTALDATRQLLEATRRAHRYHDEAHARRQIPPVEAVLRPAWELLRSLYQGTRETEPLLHELNASVRVDPPSLLHPSGASLGFEPPRVDQPGPAAIASFLDVLTGEGPVMVERRERLCVALATPRSTRDLRVLLQALAPRKPATDEARKPAFGWILKDAGNQWSAVPVRCGRKKDGSAWVIREVHREQWGVAATALDEAVEASTTLIGRLTELQQHDLVFLREGRSCDGQPRRVRRVTLGLGLVAEGDQARVRLEVDGQEVAPDELVHPNRIDRRWWVRPTATEIQFAPVTEAVEKVHELLLRRGGLVVGSGAELLEALPGLARRVAVRADSATLGVPVPADPRPLLRMSLDDAGLEVEARVQPLPDGPSAVPGEGSAVVVATRGERVVHTQRALREEPAAVRALVDSLGLGAPIGPWRWRIDGLDAALDVVEQVRARADEVVVRWGGPTPRLAATEGTAAQLALRVGQGRDWFGLDGELTVDGQAVPLATLLGAAGDGRHWVPLSEGQWVRLSDALARRLQVASSALPGKAAERQLTGLHAALLEPLAVDGAQIDAPEAFTAQADRCRQAQSMVPVLPDGLQATLRPYQHEGFAWMARLAHWAPGACLADDMGLGKTLQAITLLLHRREGAALVVAPTSLIHNWRRELERFAPSLQVRVFHGPRRALDITPGSVTLTTYGVLVHDAEQLASHRFGTVVLDEAHAIKNPSARRAKAARRLDAGFRLALTGTPVENRTAELWSLFAFLCPGLLGGATHFRQRFVQPIEVDGDRERRQLLAQVVGPFLLRRTKAKVATDLPERIEVVHQVTLSDAERGLYDKARLQGLARLQEGGGRMAILEELLRLRKLACHPRLADASSTVASSKLKAVRRLVADLRDAGQRCLIFSTFTSHLALVREALEADGHSIRYLDGSMSPRQRLVEVDAFQAGEGDVFLISTKAGGVGLNLTAATAVLHIDPWWNPAAEDQATDRAHRIGQREPVTVVRLVAEGTIEEQIVALHASKRALADALLAHGESSAPVGLEELLALLRDGA